MRWKEYFDDLLHLETTNITQANTDNQCSGDECEGRNTDDKITLKELKAAMRKIKNEGSQI